MAPDLNLIANAQCCNKRDGIEHSQVQAVVSCDCLHLSTDDCLHPIDQLRLRALFHEAHEGRGGWC